MKTALSPEIVVFIAGLAVFAIGLSLAWPPLGLIGAGAVMMIVAAFGPREESEPK